MDMKMEKMADMKMSKADKKAAHSAMVVGSEPDYPWGLQIHLDDAALKKLGITDLPDAETECHIMATGKISRVSSTSEGGKSHRSMEIQIVKLNVECKDSAEKAKSQVRAAYKKVSGK